MSALFTILTVKECWSTTHISLYLQATKQIKLYLISILELRTLHAISTSFGLLLMSLPKLIKCMSIDEILLHLCFNGFVLTMQMCLCLHLFNVYCNIDLLESKYLSLVTDVTPCNLLNTAFQENSCLI